MLYVNSDTIHSLLMCTDQNLKEPPPASSEPSNLNKAQPRKRAAPKARPPPAGCPSQNLNWHFQTA